MDFLEFVPADVVNTADAVAPEQDLSDAGEQDDDVDDDDDDDNDDDDDDDEGGGCDFI